MLVEFNSYSINDSVIKLYCTKVEETFGRDRYRPQEVVFAFDTTNIFNTNVLMNWLVRQKRVQKLKGEKPTWGRRTRCNIRYGCKCELVKIPSLRIVGSFLLP